MYVSATKYYKQSPHYLTLFKWHKKYTKIQLVMLPENLNAKPSIKNTPILSAIMPFFHAILQPGGLATKITDTHKGHTQTHMHSH